MRARLMDQETILVEIQIRDKPPKFLRGDGKSWRHCGTTRENIAIYRVKPFGWGRAMPTPQVNQHAFPNLIPFAGREW